MDNATKEQNLLALSIVATLGMSVVGIVAGLWAGSQAIVFDGFYALIDVAMTAVALMVSKLIAREGSRHFQYGYWHLEPLVTATNGIVLIAACTYGFINATRDLLAGGHVIAFGPGALYALIATAVDFVMAFYVWSRSRTLNSELLRVDARAFLIGGFLSLGLLISFALGLVLPGTRFDHWTPYIDSLVLMTLTALLMPIPVTTVWAGLGDVFQVAPSELDAHVRSVMSDVATQYGFEKFTTYVLKAGRARFIEIHVVAPPNFHIHSIKQLDCIRDDIAKRIGDPGRELWLTISFTADEKWI